VVTNPALIGLLVGAGSAGKHHARVMSRRYRELIVVDPASTVETWMKENLKPGDVYYNNLDSAISAIGDRAENVTAVIANLGPDHCSTFHRLADCGIQKIVCEKPMSDSIALATQMIDRAKADGIRLTVGFPRRFTLAASYVNLASHENLNGPPSAIAVQGGAKCLVTFGAHTVDFAIELFGSQPLRVAAVGNAASINPRGSTLGYWGGAASWEFSNDRYLTMMFTNESSVQSSATIYAPTGIFEMAVNGRITMFKRNADEIARDPRVTRVGEVDKQGVEVVSPLEASSLALILDEIESQNDLTYSGDQLVESMEAMFGALIAIETKAVVEFPLSKSHALYAKSWNVT
jgi:predicted dehydrogenase